jgi:hypothetical protein
MESYPPLTGAQRAGLENLIISYINENYPEYNNGVSQAEANNLAPHIQDKLTAKLEAEQDLALAFIGHPEVLTIIATQLTFPIRNRS